MMLLHMLTVLSTPDALKLLQSILEAPDNAVAGGASLNLEQMVRSKALVVSGSC